ncbi:hypothetical protein CY35_15G019200 [Sphagnum magellanicum]|nr:hypothetical protein CY35_15G019200 [Sphagnum magellanicum]KAH9538675.1 hypothetical protein CY35_15G019200 [Sphagnum magellanicum]KAH9538676.1 hypothetical protein CY35_15G019200 [Sphagnum magellanicum]
MEHLQAGNLLRFAEKEAEMLQQIQAKICNELHCLQDGEEEARRNWEDADGNEAGLDLLEALQVELEQFSGKNPVSVNPLQSIVTTL